MSKRIHNITFLILSAALLLLFAIDMSVGSVKIPLADIVDVLLGRCDDAATVKIVKDIRLIKAIVAVLGGAALAVSGLQMQTLFRNPLAGPYVLGLSSGASLGVAIFMLGAPFLAIPPEFSDLGTAGAAWIGSALIFLVIIFVGRRVRDIMVLLILGMMFSSGVSAVVQILQYLSRDEALKSYVIWTMGSLGEVTAGRLWVIIPALSAGFILAIFTIKSLNLLLFGQDYARSMGLNLPRARFMILLSTTLLAGTVTAFCGPIGFIGLAMPHVARRVFSDSDHRVLLPGTLLIGAAALLICDIISKAFVLPVNAITALLGIPIVIWIVLRSK